MLFKNQSNFSITFLTAKLYASCAKSLHIYFFYNAIIKNTKFV